jgi:transaldolase/glucose-6-phosphate isomerase
MKDAGIEAKRDSPVNMSGLTATLGPYEARVKAALVEADRANVIQRIWNKDAALWKKESDHQKIILNSLGWLTVAGQMLGVTAELEYFAEAIRAEGYRHAMVCGMGGSSLCPEVLRQTFGAQTGSPELLVLDSTDPDAVNNFARQIELLRCLFIVASKSGTTTEPVAFHRYWYHEVSQLSDSPGDSFIAITDPGTQMAQSAAAEKFKRVFLNPPDIGGRYSALSYFGMVPAALMGLDVKTLLERAATMCESCKNPASNNQAATLGAIMAECALAGRDKLTILADRKLSALGLWVEQLIAESTGKEGKGIIPIAGEPLAGPSAYGEDRLFVSVAVGTLDLETKSKLQALEAAGHPVVYRTLNDVYDLGAEFFLWEMATAFAGWRLAINPFNQPNVQESKDITKALLEKFAKERKLEEQAPLTTNGTITVYADNQTALPVKVSVGDALHRHIASAQAGDYIALLAYIEETPEIESALQDLRVSLRDLTGCATTSGYGPRFLHSTGQLHKGGPNSGIFFQLTAPDKIDLEVPGAQYTFSTLKQAQAQGDFKALLAHGRRAIRVDLGADVLVGLNRLKELINHG